MKKDRHEFTASETHIHSTARSPTQIFLEINRDFTFTGRYDLCDFGLPRWHHDARENAYKPGNADWFGLGGANPPDLSAAFVSAKDTWIPLSWLPAGNHPRWKSVCL